MQLGRKISIFPKGLVHGFAQKFDISSPFLFRQDGQKQTV